MFSDRPTIYILSSLFLMFLSKFFNLEKYLRSESKKMYYVLLIFKMLVSYVIKIYFSVHTTVEGSNILKFYSNLFYFILFDFSDRKCFFT